MKSVVVFTISLPTWFLFIREQPQQLSLSPARNLTLCHPGEVSWTVWRVGVKTATSSCVSAEWDCHVSPWEASLPPPFLILPLPQWLSEKSKLFQCLYIRNIFLNNSLSWPLKFYTEEIFVVLSCLSIEKQKATLTKQSSVHQAKVSSWLHSSGDMDKCCKGLFCLFFLCILFISWLHCHPALSTVS